MHCRFHGHSSTAHVSDLQNFSDIPYAGAMRWAHPLLQQHVVPRPYANGGGIRLKSSVQLGRGRKKRGTRTVPAIVDLEHVDGGNGLDSYATYRPVNG